MITTAIAAIETIQIQPSTFITSDNSHPFLRWPLGD